MASDAAPSVQDAPLRVLVAGGGVAGLEALLALRDMAGNRVDLTLLCPQDDFVYRPLAVAEAFALGHAHRYPLKQLTDGLGVKLVRGALDRVDADQRIVMTADGEPLGYDALLIATGARAEPSLEHALTWWPEGDPEAFGGLLRDLEEGYSHSVAFVVPPHVAWALPAYELAMMMAREVQGMGVDNVEITVVTPEDTPLGIFGTPAAEAVAAELETAGVQTITGVYAHMTENCRLDLEPGNRHLVVDRVVALPRVIGPDVAGLPTDDDGFIPIDEQAQVVGVDHVWAAGDGTNFPIKQGGLATQQADAAAMAIAALAGAGIAPVPFRPVLRGLLMTGDKPRFMSSDVAGGGGEGQTAAYRLWWPPVKIAGLYLAPHLAAHDPALAGEPVLDSLPGGVEVEVDLATKAEVGR